MVIHAFPVAKLGALLLKQISKPIATTVKNQAKSRPLFRKYVCLPPAQLYNWFEKKTKMWLLRMGQPVNIQILNEAAAIELGANLLGEAVIFIIAAGILISEYNRGQRKELAKEAAKKAEMEALQNTLRELFIQTEEQAAHIRELSRKLGDLETRGIIKTQQDESREKEKSSPPKDPPESVSNNTISGDMETVIKDINLIESYKPRPLRGVVFKALGDIENQFFVGVGDGQTKEPILKVALDHLYNNVYKTPLSF